MNTTHLSASSTTKVPASFSKRIVLTCLILFSPTAFAAPITLTRITGEQLKEKLSGAPVTVVNFWATWCEPCKEEFPALLKVRKKFETARFVFVSMDFESQETEIKSFLGEKKIDFETFWRTGNEMEFINSLLPKWSGALPTTAFFNSKGELVRMIQAKITERMLESQIKNMEKSLNSQINKLNDPKTSKKEN